ncbi:hypothetical protein [Rhodoblastus sp.]|uniref:hypothetical protein n=1 Tax=Rhodoblastus sp. TaxID=1962975 RepID=UPI0035AF1A61
MTASSQPMGFAGLASLATELPAAKPAVAPRAEKVAEPPPAASPEVVVRADKASFWNFRTIFFTGLIGFFILTAIFGDNKGSGSRSTSSYQPATNYQAAPSYQPQQSYSYQNSAPSTDTMKEEMPAQGSNLTLNKYQISYCLSEKIRLETMQPLADNNSHSIVTRFNSYVDDFNSRCASYRYRTSEMQAARTWVDSRRYQIQSDARATLASWR